MAHLPSSRSCIVRHFFRNIHTTVRTLKYRKSPLWYPSSNSNYGSHLVRYSGIPQPQSLYKAVIFDMGGVLIPSPFPLIAEFEKTHSLVVGSVNATIRHYGQQGSFAQLERGETTLEKFCLPFSEEYSRFTGVTVTKEQIWDLAGYLGGLNGPGLAPYKEMIAMINKLKKNGIKTVVLTNNFKFENGNTVLPKEELGVDMVCYANDIDYLRRSFLQTVSHSLLILINYCVCGLTAINLTLVGTYNLIDGIYNYFLVVKI